MPHHTVRMKIFILCVVSAFVSAEGYQKFMFQKWWGCVELMIRGWGIFFVAIACALNAHEAKVFIAHPHNTG